MVGKWEEEGMKTFEKVARAYEFVSLGVLLSGWILSMESFEFE
jgi:hypothetical protein